MKKHVIKWKELKKTPADGICRTSSAACGMEFIHLPQTRMKAETIMVHDGEDAARVIRVGQKWTRPDRVQWRTNGD